MQGRESWPNAAIQFADFFGDDTRRNCCFALLKDDKPFCSPHYPIVYQVALRSSATAVKEECRSERSSLVIVEAMLARAQVPCFRETNVTNSACSHNGCVRLTILVTPNEMTLKHLHISNARFGTVNIANMEAVLRTLSTVLLRNNAFMDLDLEL